MQLALAAMISLADAHIDCYPTIDDPWALIGLDHVVVAINVDTCTKVMYVK